MHRALLLLQSLNIILCVLLQEPTDILLIAYHVIADKFSKLNLDNLVG